MKEKLTAQFGITTEHIPGSSVFMARSTQLAEVKAGAQKIQTFEVILDTSIRNQLGASDYLQIQHVLEEKARDGHLFHKRQDGTYAPVTPEELSY